MMASVMSEIRAGETVASAASQMQGAATAMSGTAEETSRQASAVAAASEQATANVQTVATTAEELSSSIQEIGRQVEASARIAGQAVQETQRTAESIAGLVYEDVADRLNEVGIDPDTRVRDLTDEEVNKVALEKVRADKTRESGDGFDGSWVAHPGMVQTCLEVFDGVLGEKPNQVDNLREDVSVTAADLLNVKATPGEVTEQGLRANIDVALQYLAAWLTGRGAVGIHNLMEDAATAEISRSQIWQWIHNDITLADTGETVTPELVQALVEEVVPTLPGGAEQYADAQELFLTVAVADDYADFLTVPAYEEMV